ncbi:circularly permuted type 2 ATP-grasp protein [Foetidibacter luteolus]|uniref:circularly permuted type 2 ATP-grasp protein n=1 Tax=Foetidibacter luteolus TaxID=2608880 RepID=UPI00129A8432|nr:circularly permuted type 2 ATP-grasp protein [Foetidibacter luteolus]
MTSTTVAESLPVDYFNSNFSYNELMDSSGNLRPHWQAFFQSFEKLGPEELNGRNQDVLRFLKENGVTYNIYGDPDGFNRPWNLDLVPYLISREEWKTIEAGLIQRATLFDLILKDIYGSSSLVKQGIVPMDVIYNHPGFLRECTGIKLPGKHSLTMYSADMARSTDGKIWILNDRTQAPSGSGYALENRLTMARIMPELFNGLRVRRLSTYFNSLRDALNAIAPLQQNTPRIVVLTPGPGNETYFEHSYLSSFLGFALVQGNDLMVKDNYVWLKTLGGLEKVDIILRRLDDIYCDPLELKEDSQLGIPGLLQAVRKGNVSIANPLGCSVLENPGLLPFLSGIAKHLLGEELKLPTIASWWCGQKKEMDYVLANIHSLVIKQVYKNQQGSTSVDASELSGEELALLKKRIKAHPQLYVGQEKVDIAPVPSFVNGKIEPRTALFRSFAVSSNGSYTTMTGGLTRTSAAPGKFIISNQTGGISKDTWIISQDPGSMGQIHKELSHVPALRYSASSGVLPSHTAENLFWVGRYAERVLGNARLQRTVMQFVLEGNRLMEDDSDIETEYLLLKALTKCTYTYPGFAVPRNEHFNNPWPLLKEMLFDTQKTGSLAYNFYMFYRTVHTVRDHWSTDTWRVLRSMEEEWQNASAAAPHSGHSGHHKMLHALDNLVTSMVAFIGLNRESISREQGWIMLDTGRKIEQSLLLISQLQHIMVEDYDEQTTGYNLLDAVLKSNECLVNYRYKYRAHLQLPLVLDLMLLDPNNPRSLLYQLERVKAYLSSLPKTVQGHTLAEHERLILEAYTMLKLADKDKLAYKNPDDNQYSRLEKFLDKINGILLTITSVMSKNYFRHEQAPRPLSST